MSYCQFENTRQDLQQCFAAIDNGDHLSDRELLQAKKMFEDIQGLFVDLGIDSVDEIVEVMNEILEEMNG